MGDPVKITDTLLIDERPVDYDDTRDEGFHGWGAWKGEDGKAYIEYVTQEKEGAILPWTMLLLYRADVSEDVYKEHSWAVEDAHKEDIARGQSENVAERAWTLYYLGDSHGWENIDGYPLRLSAEELRERWGIKEEIVVPDEGTPQEQAARAAYRLFHLAAKNPELSLPDALTKGMTRVRRTEGKTAPSSWGYAKVAKMLHELDGRLSDYEEMTMVCVDMKNLSCCAAGLKVTRESKE